MCDNRMLFPIICSHSEQSSGTEKKLSNKRSLQNIVFERNQDGGVGRHTASPRTTRTDRESNSKGDRHQGNRK